MPRPIQALIAACALLFALNAPAQMYQGKRLVEASLIADTDAIVPGKPFTAGLLLKMAPGWHTYWQYSGDSGLPTKIDWQLPPGFKAGEIQWPLPEKITEEGDLVTYAYPGEVLLIVQITPPEKLDAKQITLPAKASWLVCEHLCVPGDANVALTLPVAAQDKPANSELFAKYRERIPKFDHNPSEGKTEWKDAKQPNTASLGVLGIRTVGKLDFYPLPPSGMTIEHPEVKVTATRQPYDPTSPTDIVVEHDYEVQVKLTSGSPDKLAGVLVFEEGDHRGSWYIPPQTSTSPLVSTASAPVSSTSALLRYLLFGFLGGMILNVMPCVLPVITLKIYGFIHQAGQSRGRILQLGLAYCAGVFAWFLGLAALIVTFGLNWSFQFQSKGFVVAMLLICVVFGLNLLGLFEVFLPGSVNTKLAALSAKEGLGGAFVHGLFATLMGSACTAPLLGPAVGFALAQPPPVIFAFFGTIAAGMALPYFLLTANPAWMRFLPKPGMWMVRIKQVMGVLVIATAVWFGYILYQQVAVKRDAFGPMLKEALKSDRTVFVDFTAEWCINCKVNEKVVLKSDPVQTAMKAGNVLFLKADWTNGDPDITQLLKQFGRAGVPLYVIYPAGSPDARNHPIVLPELLTQQIVIDGLNNAAKK